MGSWSVQGKWGMVKERGEWLRRYARLYIVPANERFAMPVSGHPFSVDWPEWFCLRERCGRFFLFRKFLAADLRDIPAGGELGRSVLAGQWYSCFPCHCGDVNLWSMKAGFYDRTRGETRRYGGP